MRIDASIISLAVGLVSGLAAAESPRRQGSGGFDNTNTATSITSSTTSSTTSNPTSSTTSSTTSGVSTVTSSHITFTSWLPTAVYSTSNDATIYWVASSATVTAAYIQRKDNDSIVATGTKVSDPAAPTVDTRRAEGASILMGELVPRDTILFPFHLIDGGGGGSLTLDYSLNEQLWKPVFDQLLYLKLEWSTADGSESGASYSPLFALATTEDEAALLEGDLATLTLQGLDASSPWKKEDIGQAGAAPTQTATPSTSASTASTLIPGNSAAGSTAIHQNSGLSTGAIAGIAVGCGVAGIAIIAATIFFLCRRRSRRNGQGKHSMLMQHNVDYASDGAAAMMADKELPHVSTDSPHSAYAQDRSQLQDPAAIGAAYGVAASHHHHYQQQQQQQYQVEHEDPRSSYVPYSDRVATPGSGPAAGSQTDLSALGGNRSPTPPIATQYAHLVEEGMTEDEIRRLEEEERQLDAAIEDAGRASRAA
ncbi:hypothetical protein BX600DRAFT_508382 [Xylariales sp. PMI_506]|nr:hypothetical protein BX600DRAFT_508382 [Xylariales sp. PMI_506]